MGKGQGHKPALIKRQGLAVGDRVKASGYYTTPIAQYPIPQTEPREGIVTHIIDDAPNPYEIDNGRGGWVNNKVATPIGSTPKPERDVVRVDVLAPDNEAVG